jgi:hypothetical protein
MTYPTLKATAEHLGALPAAHVTQFQRLERDIGAPLYHRATPGRPLRPTPQGRSLLRVPSQPNIRRLLLAETSGGTRSTHEETAPSRVQSQPA